VWEFFDIPAPVGPGAGDDAGDDAILAEATMPGAQWFVGARLNLVDQVFRHTTAERPAIVAGDESGALREVSWAELQSQVAFHLFVHCANLFVVSPSHESWALSTAQQTSFSRR
jgi:acetoacetyl-CoA synthetase